MMFPVISGVDFTYAEFGLRALGASPNRIEVLRLVLGAAEVTTADLMAELNLSRGGVLKHLDALADLGLVTARHTTHPRGSGPITYWRADEERVRDFLAAFSVYITG